jgi:hypothetical protein
MASARIAELQLELTAAREEIKAELKEKEKPTNFAKIGVYKDLIHNLTEELKTYSSTTGELLKCFLDRQPSGRCTSA